MNTNRSIDAKKTYHHQAGKEIARPSARDNLDAVPVRATVVRSYSIVRGVFESLVDLVAVVAAVGVVVADEVAMVLVVPEAVERLW